MSNTQLREAANRGPDAPTRTIVDILRADKVQSGLKGLATRYLNHERLLKLAINAISRTPRLQQCSTQSVLGAVMTSCALGLEPNTPDGQAYLIPYKRRAQIKGKWVDVYDCQFQVGYRGYITLAYRLPRVTRFQSDAIHERDLFEYMKGTDTFLKYAMTLKDRGELIGSYCYSVIDGSEAATVLPLDEILKIRARSETHRSLTREADDKRLAFTRDESSQNKREMEKAAAKLADTPWEMWEDVMAAKSAIKRHCKTLPKALGAESTALGVATELDSDAGRILDIGAMADPDFAHAVMDGDVAVGEQQDQQDQVTHQQGEKVDLPINTKDREKEPVQAGGKEASTEQKAQQRPLAGDATDFGGINVE